MIIRLFIFIKPCGRTGKVESPESIDEALIRELEEEIQVTPTKFDYMGNVKFLFPHKPKWQQDVSIFIINEWEGTPTETDVIKPEWFDIDEIPFERMWDDNSYWLPKTLKGEATNATYLYNENGEVIEEKHN